MVSDYGPGHDSEGAFHRGSRRPAAKSSERCVCRSPIPISPHSYNEPRTSIRNRSHLRTRRRTAPGARPGVRRARHRPDEDQDHRNRRNRRRAVRQEHGRCRDRDHHRMALRDNLKSKRNKEFVNALNAELSTASQTSFRSVVRTGMHVIYEALKKLAGKSDADALIGVAKGMAWESPRGPIFDRPGNTRHHSDRLYPPCGKGGRRTGKCRIR